MNPAPIKAAIGMDLLDKIDIRVGTIEAVADVPNADHLCQMRVNFGDHTRTNRCRYQAGADEPARAGREAGALRGELGAEKDARCPVGRNAVRYRLRGRRKAYVCSAHVGAGALACPVATILRSRLLGSCARWPVSPAQFPCFRIFPGNINSMVEMQ